MVLNHLFSSAVPFTRACWKTTNFSKRSQTPQTPASQMRTPLHETSDAETWCSCEWPSANLLQSHPHSPQNTTAFIVVLHSKMSQKYYSVPFYFKCWCFHCLHHCGQMTEGTFSTPLLACQLVSGDFLYLVVSLYMFGIKL